VARLGVGRPGSISGEAIFFSLPQRSGRLWGLPSLLWNGNRCSFLGVKRPCCEASAVVKNAWTYTPILPYVCMAWCVVKHRGQLYPMGPVHITVTLSETHVERVWSDIVHKLLQGINLQGINKRPTRYGVFFTFLWLLTTSPDIVLIHRVSYLIVRVIWSVSFSYKSRGKISFYVLMFVF
jgi:hypothetical protein